MRSAPTIVLATLLLAACGDTDVPERGGEPAPGEERSTHELEREVQPVELDTLPWFNEGRTVAFNGRDWIVVGEPIYDPIVEYVGEFDGTPLYAEVNVAPPYTQLFIPLDMDYWQLLEPATTSPQPATEDTGIARIR